MVTEHPIEGMLYEKRGKARLKAVHDDFGEKSYITKVSNLINYKEIKEVMNIKGPNLRIFLEG